MPDTLEQQLQAINALRTATREARETLKDLRHATKEAQALIKSLVRAELDSVILVKVDEYLRSFESELNSAMSESTDKVIRHFEHLMQILLKGRQSKLGPTIESIILDEAQSADNDSGLL